MELYEKIDKQREFFQSGETLDLETRRKALINLKRSVKKYEGLVLDALRLDLNKTPYEAYATEIGMVYAEINYMLKNLKSLSRPDKKRVSIVNFPSKGKVFKEPYGQVLIMSPWNYPFQLGIIPLIGAIAAGNCAVIKPSAYAPETASVVEKIIEDAFDEKYVFTVKGGREANKDLLTYKFDYIFFTGGKQVGRTVMKAAAEHLTPVTLELGGKSPCIVDKTADINLSARRIVWGKFINAGQTCVAPDYICVHKDVKDKLLEAIVKNIEALYGDNPLESKDYCKIINEKHFNRLLGLIEEESLYYGGDYSKESLKIGPAIVEGKWDMKAMEDEIFGPIMPVIEFENLGAVISEIKKRPKPLALYIFTKSKKFANTIIKNVSFGGGCINDTIMHLTNESLPFGGVGESGMGCYHGKYSFNTFTHEKSVLEKSTVVDLPMRYPPYKDGLKLLKFIYK